MNMQGKVSLALGGLVLLLLGAGVALKLGAEEADGAARLLTLGSFGLLLTVLGNLLPKIAPVGDSASDLRQRSAGRTIVLTGLALIVTALIAPPQLALTAGSVLGLAGLALAAATLFRSSPRREQSAMSSQLRRAILLLFVGLAGAFGLIVLDRLFGDQVAQWSAVVWVLILGLVASLTAPGLLKKR